LSYQVASKSVTDLHQVPLHPIYTLVGVGLVNKVVLEAGGLSLDRFPTSRKSFIVIGLAIPYNRWRWQWPQSGFQ
jgi:hypothetical protein